MKSYGTYKVRVMHNQRQTSYSIGLPPEVAQPLAGKKFDVFVTDEGIVLKPNNAQELVEREVVAAPEAVALASMFADEA